MTTLTSVQARFLRNETVASVVINALLAALFARLVFGGRQQVDLWGSAGLAWDLVPTAFLIAFIMTLIVTMLTWRRLRAGSAPSVAWARAQHAWLGGLPRSLPLRAVAMGLLSVVLFVPPAVLVLYQGQLCPMAPAGVYGVKIVFSAAVALVFTPVVLLAAMSDRPQTVELQSLPTSP